MQETSCTTTYREDSPGRFLGDTRCSSLPVEVCGAGCVTEEGEEECHDKQVRKGPAGRPFLRGSTA